MIKGVEQPHEERWKKLAFWFEEGKAKGCNQGCQSLESIKLKDKLNAELIHPYLQYEGQWSFSETNGVSLKEVKESKYFFALG